MWTAVSNARVSLDLYLINIDLVVFILLFQRPSHGTLSSALTFTERSTVLRSRLGTHTRVFRDTL